MASGSTYVRRLRGVLLGFAALGVAVAARADMEGAYISDSNFTIWHKHMPDLDQRRAAASGIVGLPGNGSMYCVPTASMNTIMYAANHGFPWVSPGLANWQLQANYNTAGNLLTNLGMIMGTDAADGTGGNGWYNGVFFWMAPYAIFNVEKYFASGFYSPTFLSLSKKALNGALVSLAYGRYTVTGVNGNVVTVSTRNGGHAVTFSRALVSGSNKTLKVRDPADDSVDLYSQSQFGDRVFDITDLVIVGPGWVRVMSAINWPSDDGLIRLIDGVVTIKPKWGISFTNTGEPKIKLHFPYPLLNDFVGHLPEINIPGTTITDIHQLPGNDELVALCDGSVRLIDPVTGTSKPVGDITDARKATPGRQRQLYILAGRILYCLDPDDPNVPSTNFVIPPHPCDGLDYDDAADQVVLLSLADRRILRYNRALSILQANLLLPANVMVAGDGSVKVNPLDGRASLCSGGSDSIFEIYQSPIGGVVGIEHALPAVQHPKTLNFDDNGHLFVQCDAGLLEFMKPVGAGWTRVLDSAFASLPIGEGFRISRSRNNHDPATMEGPAFRNLLQSEITDGRFETDNPGDMNCDGVLDFKDINPFVLALSDPVSYARTYPSCTALNGDVNFDGVVDFKDINPFVALLSAGQ